MATGRPHAAQPSAPWRTTRVNPLVTVAVKCSRHLRDVVAVRRFERQRTTGGDSVRAGDVVARQHIVAHMSETVIVVGTFEVDPERRDAFLESRVAGMNLARGEPGCTTYVLSADPIEPNLGHLLERWESKAYLDDHLERLRRNPPATAVTAPRTELTVYETSGEAPLIL